MTEEWRAVVNYEGRYEVSSLGRVRSLLRGKQHIMSGVLNSDGYPTVRLSGGHGDSKRFRIHRLVCRAFHGPQPWGHEAAHLDGSRTNAAADNLRWTTPKENHAHKRLHGTRQVGERNGRARLTPEKAGRIRALARDGQSERLIAREIGVEKTAVHRVLTGETWTDGSPPVGSITIAGEK